MMGNSKQPGVRRDTCIWSNRVPGEMPAATGTTTTVGATPAPACVNLSSQTATHEPPSPLGFGGFFMDRVFRAGGLRRAVRAFQTFVCSFSSTQLRVRPIPVASSPEVTVMSRSTMNSKTPGLGTRLRIWAVPALVLAMVFGLAASPVAAERVYTEPVFELGDGSDPLIPGQADIVGTLQAGPDWADLFQSATEAKDVIDEFGEPYPNGVPDYLDGFGLLRARRDAAFVAGAVGNVGDPAQDIGNAYAYTGFNDSYDLLLYVGAERLSSGQSLLTFEFNQALVSLDENDQPLGDRTVGDIRVVADFSAGILSAISLFSWEVIDPDSGSAGWVAVDILPISQEQAAEQCNPAGTICAVCNGTTIEGGEWTSFDASGYEVEALTSDTFLEFGINLTRLFGHHTFDNYYSTRFTSIQVSTGLDYALGHFNRAASIAGSA
jgi:hypothetical protein